MLTSHASNANPSLPSVRQTPRMKVGNFQPALCRQTAPVKRILCPRHPRCSLKLTRTLYKELRALDLKCIFLFQFDIHLDARFPARSFCCCSKNFLCRQTAPVKRILCQRHPRCSLKLRLALYRELRALDLKCVFPFQFDIHSDARFPARSFWCCSKNFHFFRSRSSSRTHDICFADAGSSGFFSTERPLLLLLPATFFPFFFLFLNIRRATRQESVFTGILLSIFFMCNRQA